VFGGGATKVVKREMKPGPSRRSESETLASLAKRRGKSTFAKVLMGLEDCEDGQILLGNRSIAMCRIQKRGHQTGPMAGCCSRTVSDTL